jgi:molybdopterin converting factor small subunit
MTVSASPLVSIRVLLFGSYAEVLGQDSLTVRLPRPATVAGVLQYLRALPGGDRLPERPLVGVNLGHGGPETPLADGDELAILPPLAGG